MLDVLLVDDDEMVRSSVAAALADAGHQVTEAEDGTSAATLIESRVFDLAICDVCLPGTDGLALLRRLKRDAPGTAVILISSFGKIPEVMSSLRGGAADYVTKPFDPDEFARHVVGPIAARRSLREKLTETRATLTRPTSEVKVVARSYAMRALLGEVAVHARSHAPVLVSGERGSGKELVARTIHAQSTRHHRAFVKLSCARIPQALDRDLAAADGGTLFLDELESLTSAGQSALLYALKPLDHERRDPSWRPLGARIVSSTAIDLETSVACGGFLRQLHARLAAAHVRVPPLRERTADLFGLVEQLVRDASPPGRVPPGVTPRAWLALRGHAFPGNVGELRRAIVRAVALAEDNNIDVAQLPEEMVRGRRGRASSAG